MRKYHALMHYIANRSDVTNWCEQLRHDERAAEQGEFALVAAELAQAQADYKAEQEALGRSGYPYNADMGTFLGLPLRSNNEPPHGYYMANCVMHHYRLGAARREVERLKAEGKQLAIVTARDKKTRKPIRFARFSGEQIKPVGGAVTVSDGKRGFTLSSTWSAETAMESVARAMRDGVAYGEATQP